MTSTDDILNQIDTALEDGTVSYDAMRSRPAPPPPSGPRLCIAPAGTAADGDGWEEIGHVTDLDLTIDDGQDAIEHGYTADEITVTLSFDTGAATAALATAIEGVRRFREALEACAEAFSRAHLGPREGEWVDTNGDPVPAVPVAPSEARTPSRKQRRKGDRPAWQSKYGPAHRRR